MKSKKCRVGGHCVALRPTLGLVALLAVLGAPQLASAHAITGALFTTTQDGNTINGNIYLAKCGADGVWLNGGPQGPNPGLPADDYVFQVTDPSGSTLLSTDTPDQRLVRVDASGRFVSLTTDAGTGTHNTADLSSPTRIAVELCPFSNTPNPGGEYKVWLTRVSDFTSPSVGNCSLATGGNLDDGLACNGSFGFVPGHIKTDNFKAPPDDGGPPTETSTISGTKFYDANVNGANDSEVGIQGWQVCISGGPDGFQPICTTTDGNGFYSFAGLEDGTYALCEVIPSQPPVWIPTTPTGITGVSVPIDSTGNDFGNVCLGAGGGKTLGFWSNKNGQALITAYRLCALNDLNLRDASGSDFDPVQGCPSPSSTQVSAGKTAFRSWLLSANATNMAYMLSAQLAAMKLNVLTGGVDGSSIVYAPQCGNTGLNNAFISISDLIASADAQLVYTLTFAGHPAREAQECLKDALDDANNNLNFVQPAACEVNYSGSETCTPN